MEINTYKTYSIYKIISNMDASTMTISGTPTAC